MDAHEMILRQSLLVLQATIDDLCKRRDQIAAQLPNAPKPVMPKFFNGREIKPGAWKTKKRGTSDREP